MWLRVRRAALALSPWIALVVLVVPHAAKRW